MNRENDMDVQYDQFYLSIDETSKIEAKWQPANGDLQAPAIGRIPLRGATAQQKFLIDSIRDDLPKLKQVEYRKDLRNLQHFGKMLFLILFPDEVASLFNKAYASAKEGGRRLRLVIQVDEESTVYHWPLEYLYDDHEGQFLATQDQIVMYRHARIGKPISKEKLEPKDRPPFKVLLVISRGGLPMGVERSLKRWVESSLLRLDKEIFQNRIKVAVLGDQDPDELEGYGFEVYLEPATRTSLRQYLEDWEPDLLHFIGHGRFNEQTWKGELALLRDGQEDDSLDFIDCETLIPILEKGKKLKLVVLQACEGASAGNWERGFLSLADEIYKQGIPAVVAMQYKIENICANRFANGFYEALSAYSTIDEAVQRGRYRVYEGVGDHVLDFNMPVLIAELQPIKLMNENRRSNTRLPRPTSGNPSMQMGGPTNAIGKALNEISIAEKMLDEGDIESTLGNLVNAKKYICDVDEAAVNFIDHVLESLQLSDEEGAKFNLDLASRRLERLIKPGEQTGLSRIRAPSSYTAFFANQFKLANLSASVTPENEQALELTTNLESKPAGTRNVNGTTSTRGTASKVRTQWNDVGISGSGYPLSRGMGSGSMRFKNDPSRKSEE